MKESWKKQMSKTENVELTVEELIRVINDPALTEFQYLVDGETWTVAIK